MAAYIWSLLCNADTLSLADQTEIIHKEGKYAIIWLQNTRNDIPLSSYSCFFLHKEERRFFFVFSKPYGFWI